MLRLGSRSFEGVVFEFLGLAQRSRLLCRGNTAWRGSSGGSGCFLGRDCKLACTIYSCILHGGALCIASLLHVPSGPAHHCVPTNVSFAFE